MAAHGFDQFGRFGCIVFADVTNPDPHAATGQCQRNAAPDARAGTTDIRAHPCLDFQVRLLLWVFAASSVGLVKP